MPSSCLPPLLCILLPLHFAGTEAHPYLRPNITLVFDSTIHNDSLRNCSCAAAVRQCDEVLANLLCNCGTVSRSSLTPGGLRLDNRRTEGTLVVWVRELWVLKELLNGSHVPDLHLSLCSPVPLFVPAQYLTFVGLKRLQVYISAKEALHQEQALNINSRAELDVQDSGLSITLLDMGSLSGALRLKSYSVVGPSLQSLKHHFPNVIFSGGNVLSSDPERIHKPLMLTFIY